MAADNSKEPSIGEVVKRWRESRRLTTSQLAQRAMVPQPYISQLEHDKIRHPRDQVLHKLAAALNLPLVDLLTRRLPSERLHESSWPQDGQLWGATSTFSDPSASVGTGARTVIARAIDNMLIEADLRPSEEQELSLLVLPHLRQLIRLVKGRRPERLSPLASDVPDSQVGPRSRLLSRDLVDAKISDSSIGSSILHLDQRGGDDRPEVDHRRTG